MKSLIIFMLTQPEHGQDNFEYVGQKTDCFEDDKTSTRRADVRSWFLEVIILLSSHFHLLLSLLEVLLRQLVAPVQERLPNLISNKQSLALQ